MLEHDWFDNTLQGLGMLCQKSAIRLGSNMCACWTLHGWFVRNNRFFEKVMINFKRKGFELDQSGYSPRQEILTSGYHNYQLKGLNLRYMYFSQKTFLNKLKYINMIIKKWCSYWYVFIFINFGFKVRCRYVI